MLGCGNRSFKFLKWCCGITAVLIIIVTIVFVVFFFTLFKPKEPTITTQPATLESFNLIFFPLTQLNVTLGEVVTVDNPNYGGFKYHNGTAYINYDGTVVGEAPIEEGKIPARGEQNISISITIFADKLASNSNFLGDLSGGVLNFTSTTTLHGKVSVLKIFKKKATSFSSCNISLFILTQSIESGCKSKVEL